ncbi:MAG: hypothetical protein ACRC62_00780, partial [Microcoleus sp.]
LTRNLTKVTTCVGALGEIDCDRICDRIRIILLRVFIDVSVLMSLLPVRSGFFPIAHLGSTE